MGVIFLLADYDEVATSVLCAVGLASYVPIAIPHVLEISSVFAAIASSQRLARYGNTLFFRCRTAGAGL